MLVAYTSSLTAYRDRSSRRSNKQGKPRKSLDKWNLAIQRAEEALSKSRGAELLRQAGDFDNADTMAQNAINALKFRYETPACCHVVIDICGF